ncbi:MAG: phosphate ABC transporter permease subunit PstC [Planctomycetes bacterium]|nr:phosphate ABC transporter permease subunit PstC [Planctomycetota bacterium]
MPSPPSDHPLIRRNPRLAEKAIEAAIRLSAFFVIAALALIFIFIAREAVPLLTSAEVHEEVTVSRMVAPLPNGKFSWQPVSTVPKYSLLPLLAGTLKVTLVALLIALPLAVGAAIFTSEFAPPGLREVIKPVIELLAGIPSVVIGFFALMVVATWVQEAFGLVYRLNAITAGIGLSLAVIPIVYTVAEDALSAVPQSFRDGSLALGANRWQTAWRVVLPAAMPGVMAAGVLGFGRAIGETMIVLMASGNAAISSLDPRESFRSISATIAAELGEVVHGSAHYHVLFFLGALLFVITFLLNLAGHAWAARLRTRLEGGGRR